MRPKRATATCGRSNRLVSDRGRHGRVVRLVRRGSVARRPRATQRRGAQRQGTRAPRGEGIGPRHCQCLEPPQDGRLEVAGKAESIDGILKKLRVKPTSPQPTAPARLRGAGGADRNTETGSVDQSPAPTSPSHALLGNVGLGTTSEGATVATAQAHHSSSQEA